MDTIAFKLSDEFSARLAAVKLNVKETSRHKLAKQIVIDYLQDAEWAQMRREISELRQEVTRLREDLAVVVVALLMKAGKIEDREDAKRWAASNLLEQSSGSHSYPSES